MDRNKTSRISLAIAILIVASVAAFGIPFIFRVFSFYEDNYVKLEMENLEFQETADELDNPFQGYYDLKIYTVTDDLLGDTLDKRLTKEYNDSVNNKSSKLLLVEIDLSDYTHREMTPNAIATVDTILKFWKLHRYTMVVRFLYDLVGDAEANEPESVEIIKNHMKSCSVGVNFHSDAILTLQGVFVGNWGEMHGSKYLTPETIRELMEYQCEVFEPNVFMAVRTPAQRRSVVQSAEDIASNEAYSSLLQARVGLFDDAIMSSDTDLGTFGEGKLSDIGDDFSLQLDRSEELDYQKRICKYVPNGGEICYDTPLSDVKNAIKILRQMKISYINADSVSYKWASKKVNTDDAFDGMIAEEYIKRHLGYRYHYSSVGTDFDCYRDDTFDINIGITNTGFAPVYKPTSAKLVVVDDATGKDFCEAWIEDIDLRLLDTSDEGVGVVKIPKEKLKDGDYTVYIKYFFDYGERKLIMANDLKLDDKKGYKLCQFSVDRNAPEMSFIDKLGLYIQYGGR